MAKKRPLVSSFSRGLPFARNGRETISRRVCWGWLTTDTMLPPQRILFPIAVSGASLAAFSVSETLAVLGPGGCVAQAVNNGSMNIASKYFIVT